ncbi:MAG: hypothetical protein ACREBW_03645 [Candidatus Micrarchaeaceae archaeon]
MKRLRIIATSGLMGTAIALCVSGTAFAWHPHGQVTKTVQDITTSSQTSSATSADNALTVAPGNTLLYTVTVSNIASPADNHDNDMAYAVMTDALPSGVELLSNPSQRTITENIGTIVPGNKVTKQYQVKVTDTTDGDVITNQACYTGNSIVKDNAQSGCSTVVVKVRIPSYACTVFSTTQGANRTITISNFDKQAVNGATFTNVVVDWNDDTAPFTGANPIGQTHTYGADGAYHIVATAHFMVNSVDRMATSSVCASDVKFTTPTPTPTPPPTQLPNTGTGSTVAILATATALLGYAAFALRMKYRVNK